MFFHPLYFLFIAPAALLGFWAQWKIRSSYAAASRVPAALSGAAAARHILDSAGMNDVEIEMIGGTLSDHYDPRHKVLRLSQDVYHGRTAAAVGVAAHEAGHAMQDAQSYTPLVIRNAAVPMAGFGSKFSMIMIFIGAILSARVPGASFLITAGIALFGVFVVFQVVNLPVEFNASTRAKRQLVSLGIVDDEGLVYVRKTLNAAALTYVAATAQAILTLMYYLYRFSGRRS